jgi:hypothetical protein
MTMTPTDRAGELLRLREKATAGEWVATDYTREPTGFKGVACNEAEVFVVQPGTLCDAEADFIAFCGTHAAAIVAEQGATIERLEQENAVLRAKAEYHDASALVGKMYYGFFGDNGVTNEQVDAAKERARIATESLFALAPEYFQPAALEVQDAPR